MGHKTFRFGRRGILFMICQFMKDGATFTGCIVSKSDIKPVSEKVKKIINFQRPLTISELKLFLSMFAYLCKFVENFLERSVLLFNLCKKKKQ